MRDGRLNRTILLALLLVGATGCGSAGRALFTAAVVTAYVVQTTATVCAQEDVDCSGPRPSGTTIEIRDTHDPYGAAVDW